MLTIDLERLDVRPGDLVLDLGCGAGRHTYAVQRAGAVAVAADRDDVAVKGTFQMMHAVASSDGVPAGSGLVADAARLPFADAVFDRVIAAEILEHIPDDVSVMAEIARVVKPGGKVAISVPRAWTEAVCWLLSNDYRRSAGGHVRIYRRSQLRDRTRLTGLRSFGTHHAHAFHSPYWWLRCATGLDGTGALARAYHRLLVWDIVTPNRLFRAAERVLDPVLGKSVVLYLTREDAR